MCIGLFLCQNIHVYRYFNFFFTMLLSPPPPHITQLPSETLYITMIYTYLSKRVV